MRRLITGATVIALTLVVSDAFAKGPKGGSPPGLSNRTSSTVGLGPTNRPYGWSQGKKRGWLRGDCRTIGTANCIPPGLRNR